MTATVLPSWSGAAHSRNLASAALRLGYTLRVHGAHYVGTIGPLVMVCRAEGVLAGSILQATVTRPIHVIANEAMSAALAESVMRKTGVIPVSSPLAIDAQRSAVAALEDDRAVAVTGHAMPSAYLIARTGAPVMPVVIFGDHGKVATDPPRPRSRIDVFYTEPVRLEVGGDPLHPGTRTALEERVRQLVTDAERTAARRVGRVTLGG